MSYPLRPICVKCQVECQIEMSVDKSGVLVKEMYQNDTQVQAVWMADLWRCPHCRTRILGGFGTNPVAWHFDGPNFRTALGDWDRLHKTGHAFFWFEKFQKEGVKPSGK